MAGAKGSGKRAPKKTLTIRANPNQSKSIDQLILFTGVNTASRALLHAGEHYIELVNERDTLRRELADLRRRYSDLTESIEDKSRLEERIQEQTREARAYLDDL